MSKLIRTCLIVTACSLAGLGCKSGSSEAAADGGGSTTRPNNAHARTFDALPEGHTFRQLRYSMGEAEVRDTIGEPTDVSGYVTGQAFNPFYYGTDTNRSTWYYKGLGRLTFNSRGRLIEAHANPSETGYR